jgi:hypothetical protein
MRRSASWLLREADIVVGTQGSIQRVLRMLGLDQHFARQCGAPAATADLHQLREQAFRRAEIGGEQRGVGTDRADQGQVRKIVALGQHLGADQDVGLAGMDGRQQRLPFLRRTGGIAVDAQHTCLREALAQHGFEALGATAEGQQIDIAAVRAGARNAGFETAVVAAQALVGQMQHQVGRAAAAARNPAAGRAGQHRRIAAPVEEDQALLAALEAHGERGEQFRREALLQLLAPRVDHLHAPACLRHGALGQLKQPIAARCMA